MLLVLAWVYIDVWNPCVQVQQGNGAGDAQAADAPLPTGRLLTFADITPTLKGRQAEVCTRNVGHSRDRFM